MNTRFLAAAPALMAMACAPAGACLWEYRTNADGQVKEVSAGPPRPRFHAPQPPEGWKARAEALQSAADFATHFETRNDYAVALIHLGRYAEAVRLLQAIEKARPGTYVIAVNLGTAYELSGKDELALKWIVEGVRRNPQSHSGTEWLHVRILEAKLALRKNPDWLRGHAVFDGGAALTGELPAPKLRAEPVRDHTGQERAPDDISRALEYQLTERLQFVKAPEPLVGELLLELASLTALQEYVELAVPVIRQAGEFRPARAELQAQRARHFDQLIRANPRSGKPAHRGSGEFYFTLIAAALVAVPLALVLYLLVRRRRRRPSREAGS